jgi:ribonuclease HI
MKIFCDGGARGNPGPAASAFVVFNNKGERVAEGSKYLGENTNNVAEYNSLILALSWANKNAREDITIVMDSELVKKQMTGEYRIKNENLKRLAESAKALEKSFSYGISYEHSLRSGNYHADSLVNLTLDSNSLT